MGGGKGRIGGEMGRIGGWMGRIGGGKGRNGGAINFACPKGDDSVPGQTSEVKVRGEDGGQGGSIQNGGAMR